MSISLSNSTLRCQERPCGEDDECRVEAYEEAVGEVVLWRFMKALFKIVPYRGETPHSFVVPSEFLTLPSVMIVLYVFLQIDYERNVTRQRKAVKW